MEVNLTAREESERTATIVRGSLHGVELFQFYYTPILVHMGVLGNCLSVYVFFSTKLRQLSSTYYLSALAISDSGFLVALFVVWLNMVEVDLFNRDGVCQAMVYMTSVCSFLSVWLVVAFTVERFVAVQYPLLRPSVCTVKRARSTLAALAVFAFGSFSPLLVLASPQYFPERGVRLCTLNPDWHDAAGVFNAFDTIITFIVPVVIIVGLNACIGRTVWRLARVRRRLTARRHYDKTFRTNSELSRTIGTSVTSTGCAKYAHETGSDHCSRQTNKTEQTSKIDPTRQTLNLKTGCVDISLQSTKCVHDESSRRKCYVHGCTDPNQRSTGQNVGCDCKKTAFVTTGNETGYCDKTNMTGCCDKKYTRVQTDGKLTDYKATYLDSHDNRTRRLKQNTENFVQLHGDRNEHKMNSGYEISLSNEDRPSIGSSSVDCERQCRHQVQQWKQFKPSQQQQRGSFGSQTKVTKMLLIVSTVFLCLNLPSYVMRVMAYLIELEMIDGIDMNLFLTLQHFCMQFFNTNFGINFVLYCVSGQNFRNAVKSLACRKYRQRRRNETVAFTVTDSRTQLSGSSIRSRKKRAPVLEDVALVPQQPLSNGLTENGPYCFKNNHLTNE